MPQSSLPPPRDPSHSSPSETTSLLVGADVAVPSADIDNENENDDDKTSSFNFQSPLTDCLPLHIFLASFAFLALLVFLTLATFPLHLSRVVPFPKIPSSLSAARASALNLSPGVYGLSDPMDTSAEWTNLLFPPDPNTGRTNPFSSHPYIISHSPSLGLGVTSSLFSRLAGTKQFEALQTAPDIYLAPTTPSPHALEIDSFSSMSVTLSLGPKDGPKERGSELGGSIRIPATVGSPYLTVLAPSAGVTLSNAAGEWAEVTTFVAHDDETDEDVCIFVLRPPEGSDNAWLVYSPAPPHIEYTPEHTISSLTFLSDSPFPLRLFSFPSKHLSLSTFSHTSLLRGFASCYPVSSRIFTTPPEREGGLDSVQFQYTFSQIRGRGKACVHEFLTMPHHGGDSVGNPDVAGVNLPEYFSSSPLLTPLLGINGEVTVRAVKVEERGEGTGKLFGGAGAKVERIPGLDLRDFKVRREFLRKMVSFASFASFASSFSRRGDSRRGDGTLRGSRAPFRQPRSIAGVLRRSATVSRFSFFFCSVLFCSLLFSCLSIPFLVSPFLSFPSLPFPSLPFPFLSFPFLVFPVCRLSSLAFHSHFRPRLLHSSNKNLPPKTCHQKLANKPACSSGLGSLLF